MKVLLFLLIPIITFAQDFNFSDSLILKKGIRKACFVRKLDKTKAEILYGKDELAVVPFIMMSELKIDKLGTVYSQSSGLLLPEDSITRYLSNRNNQRENEIKNRKIAEAFRRQEMMDSAEKAMDLLESTTGEYKGGNPNRWSFGITYIPNFESNTYYISDNYYSPPQVEVRVSSAKETLFEGQFTYLVIPDLRLTLDLGYSNAYEENGYEEHREIPINSSTYHYGRTNINSLKLFTFDLGLKYNITRILNQKVSAFILAGIGKQYAFAKSETKYPFTTTSLTDYYEYNTEEFIEDLNSPFHINLGFGAEYFFNKSLSIFSNIRFYYTSVDTKYEYRSINTWNSNAEMRSGSTTVKLSDVYTRIGIGMNFYF